MEQELECYLNDHLAGSSGALLLIQELIDRAKDSEASEFFTRLKMDVSGDRELLEGLLSSLGSDPSAVKKAAGNIAARVGFLKLAWEGFKPGDLGLLEALEMLALGVQGKRLLWRALGEIAHRFPEWEGMDFRQFERDAVRQRDGVERRRMAAARLSLIPPERRSE